MVCKKKIDGITRFVRYLQKLRFPIVPFISLSPDAKTPKRQTPSAAGYDLSSIENLEVPAHGRVLVHTGIAVAPPPSCHIEIRPRSGLALHHGITVLNAPGTIDADYRGEIMVLLLNTSDVPYEIHVGDRIAQAVIMKHENVTWMPVDAFDETLRGIRGFGSTGKK